MKGDFTRSTFDKKKHYSSVRMQQGRVQLDADWNEQVDIQKYLLEQSLQDVVGPCGAPLQNAGFALTVDKRYLFSWDNIPGNDNRKLIDFLNQNYSIDWVETAKIEKIDDGKTIILSTEKNSLYLKLNDKKTNVSLKIDDGRTGEFTAKMKNSKLNIYNRNNLMIGAGHYYVHGTLCENERECNYLEQENIKDAKLPDAYLFSWDEIPGNDNGKLIEFLKQKYGIDWVKTAEIEKIENGNTIKVSTEINHLSLNLNQEETEVIFKINDVRTDKFIAKMENGKLNIYADGNYLFYLDVWQKHVTAVEDESISEIALGGPDTTTRTKTIWQVKYIQISGTLDENPCIQSFDEWDKLTAKRDAQLRASVAHVTSPTDPCIVPSGAGYRGLENHFYRVEIHRVDGGNTTFKWSRDNGSILRAVDTIVENVITIKNAGQDILHAFEHDQWIEITDDRRELNEEPGTLVHLTEVKDGIELKFDPDDPDGIIGDPVNSKNYPEKYNPKVRRWDQTESGEIMIDSEWIELEHGLGVEFKTDNEYKSGDFWLIPARAANGDIEWSQENGGWHQRFGIEHRYCPLAIVTYKDENTKWEIFKDCRWLFPNMTEMVTLSYVGGDGQEAMPGYKLPAPLQVRVSVGQHPIKNARVQFSITDGMGNLKPRTEPAVTTLTINTGDDGLAEIGLQLDEEYTEDETSVGVEASLLDAMLLDDEGESLGVHPSIHFQANVSIAKKVYYDPKLCPDLNEKGINTVQEAIDELCNCCKPEDGIYIEEIYIKRAGTDQQQPLANDSPISVDDLANGIWIRCDQKIDPITIERKPTCFVTLDMPYPFNSADMSLWSDEYLFSWDEIPGSDEGELIDFLKQNYSIDWLENAEITKSDDGKTIKLFTKNNRLYLKLNDNNTNVSLEIDGDRIGEFIAKMENNELNIYDTLAVIGFQPLILADKVRMFRDNVIYWQPTESTKTWLTDSLFQAMLQHLRGDRLLAHLTLKGNFIWAQEDPSLYLDGEAFGIQAGSNKIKLDLPSGNGRRGGDFEMWFWLMESIGISYVEYNVPEGLLVENGLCQNGSKNCEETQDGIPGGRFYAMVGNRVALNGNSDALVDLLVNEGVGDKHTIHVGEPFNLPGGITFTPQEIYGDGKRAKFSLSKDGEEISNKVVNAGELYTHIEKEIMGETDVPVFVTFVETIFAGQNTNLVNITSTWLISMDA